jgi:hypothetical protein
MENKIKTAYSCHPQQYQMSNPNINLFKTTNEELTQKWEAHLSEFIFKESNHYSRWQSVKTLPKK